MGKSEFGMGLTYCIGLFLAHEERIQSDLVCYKKISDENRAYSMWFYSASDHLYDLQIPTDGNLSKNLQNRLKKFKSKCLSLRLPIEKEKQATKEDFYWAIKEAKTLLRLIDKSFGIKTQKGSWE